MVADPAVVAAAWQPCDDCDRVGAEVFHADAAFCRRCVARREAGEPRKVEVEAAEAAAAHRRFRFLKGYHNAEIV
jgi:hypothetical protein